MKSVKSMIPVQIGIEKIKTLLPHREPFIFVDRVTELLEGERILAERDLRSEESYFAGHFPNHPIMPGVLITEALAQTSGLLLALTELYGGGENRKRLFYLARTDMKWTEPVRPGETLKLESRHVRTMAKLVNFRVRAFTNKAEIASGSLTLAEMSAFE